MRRDALTGAVKAIMQTLCAVIAVTRTSHPWGGENKALVRKRGQANCLCPLLHALRIEIACVVWKRSWTRIVVTCPMQRRGGDEGTIPYMRQVTNKGYHSRELASDLDLCLNLR